MSLAAIAIGAGFGLQASGQIKQGQIAAAQGEFEQKIAQRNQRALERQAVAEKEAAAIDEGRIARRSRIVQAQLRAGQSKSGIGLAGATIESLSDAAFQFSLDRNLTLRRGMIRARELQTRGGILAAQGDFAKRIGKQRRTAAFIGAAGSALSGAGSLGLGGFGSSAGGAGGPAGFGARSPLAGGSGVQSIGR